MQSISMYRALLTLYDRICILFTKQLTQEYPTILTPDNDWIIGITQEPFTREYYLVFYHEICPIIDRLIQRYYHAKCQYMQYDDFGELKEIGVGGYGTVYTAKYKKYSEVKNMKETVVLKRFKSFDETPELFTSEVSKNNW